MAFAYAMTSLSRPRTTLKSLLILFKRQTESMIVGLPSGQLNGFCSDKTVVYSTGIPILATFLSLTWSKFDDCLKIFTRERKTAVSIVSRLLTMARKK